MIKSRNSHLAGAVGNNARITISNVYCCLFQIILNLILYSCNYVLFRFLLVAIVPILRCQLSISSPIYRLEIMLMGAIWMAGWKDRWIERWTIIV